MPFKLKRATLRNWQTVRSTELEFPDHGLVLVLGQNLAAKGRLKSVGAGKTALGDAISRTLLGVRGRFSHLGAFSCDATGNKDMMVKLELEDGAHRLVVESGFRCKDMSRTGEALRFTLDGTLVERGDLNDTRRELADAVRVSSDLAEHTIHVDGDRLKFSKLPQRTLVDLVMDTLGQAAWDTRQGSVRRLANEHRANRDKLTTQLNALRDRARDLAGLCRDGEEDVTAADKDLTAARAEQANLIRAQEVLITALATKVAAREATKKDLRRKMKLIEETVATELHQLEIRLNDAKAVVETANETYMTAMRAVTAITTDKTNTRKRLTDHEKSLSCPTCRRAYDNQADKEAQVTKLRRQMEDLEAETKELTDAERAARQEKDRATRLADQIQNDLTALARQNDTAALSAEYERLESNGARQDRDLAELKQELAFIKQPPSDAALVKAKAVLRERVRETVKVGNDIDALKADLDKADRIIEVMEYWETAFGPAGIPNLILHDGLGVLNHACARLSQVLTGGTLELKYATTREMASGDTRPELAIEVLNTIGSKRLEGGSKGESGLTNLILAEALAEVARTSDRVGYRWFDEVVNNQDALVRSTIYGYLREQAHARKILIFVVDHHADVTDHADYTLVATKDASGATTYSWN